MRLACFVTGVHTPGIPKEGRRSLENHWASVDRAHLEITDRGITVDDHSQQGLAALRVTMREMTSLPLRDLFLQVSLVSTEALVWLAAQALVELGEQGWEPDIAQDEPEEESVQV